MANILVASADHGSPCVPKILKPDSVVGCPGDFGAGSQVSAPRKLTPEYLDSVDWQGTVLTQR